MKKYLILYGLFVVLFLYTCFFSSQITNITSQTTLTPNGNFATHTPLSQKSPVPEESLITPAWEVKKSCAVEKDVSIEDLKLAYGLLVVYADDDSSRRPLFINPGTSEPKQLDLSEKLKSQGATNYVVSQDKKWISFLIPIGDEKNELWIISSNGTKGRRTITLPSTAYINWLSNNQLLIIGIPEEYTQLAIPDAYKYVPMTLVDPLNLETINLSLPPLDPKNNRQFSNIAYFDKNGNDYAVFQNLNISGNYELFDYSYQSYMPIFTWLTSRNFSYSMFAKMWLDGKKLTLVLPNEIGIEISYITISNPFDNKDQPIVLDLPQYLIPSTGLAVVPNSNQVILMRLDDSYSKPFWLFKLDVQKKTIYDYCIDLPDVPNYVRLSPDGYFAAISLNTKGSMIVDLRDGSFTILPSYRIVDWLDFSN